MVAVVSLWWPGGAVVWAFHCKEEEEYEKDIFLKSAKLKNCCIRVAFRKFSSSMREEFWGRLELLHFWRRKTKHGPSYKNPSRTPCCIGMFLVQMPVWPWTCLLHIVWKDVFRSYKDWISPIFNLSSLCYIKYSCKVEDLLVTHSHGNCGVRPVCLLEDQSLELTDSAQISRRSDTSVLWGTDYCHFHLSPCALPQCKGLIDGIWCKAASLRGWRIMID